MKRSNVVSTVVVSAVLVIAGCGGSSSTSKASSSSSSAPATSVASSSGSTAPSTTAAAEATTLAVTMNASVGKQIIVDGAGKTVYLYDPDGTSGTSQVPASIKALWPAVPATAAPTVGTGLDASKVATQTQSDGTKQVSYNGHLLYTFQNDSAPGDAKGQALGNIWFTVSPAGDKNA